MALSTSSNCYANQFRKRLHNLAALPCRPTIFKQNHAQIIISYPNKCSVQSGKTKLESFI